MCAATLRRTFEFIPISERDTTSTEYRTYRNIDGQHGKSLSTYLPNAIVDRKLHFDLEFKSFTYGDPTSKRKYLLTLMADDILVFYAGLSPFQNRKFETRLYIIGYFTVEKVIDFNCAPPNKIEEYRQIYANNAHIKIRSTKDLVIVAGYKDKSNTNVSDKLLRKSVFWKPRFLIVPFLTANSTMNGIKAHNMIDG